MRKTTFEIKALIICLLLTVCFQFHPGSEPGTRGTQKKEKGKTQLGIPVQLLPENNSSFKGYPTTLTLEWKPVKGADSYDVEIDCLGCRQAGKWDSETGKVWKIAPEIAKTKYTFIFAGNYRGRWRVRAAKDIFKRGEWSPWRYFKFDTGKSKKTAIQACGIVLESLSKTSGSEGDSFYMHGVWGTGIGQKMPCLKNKNKIIPLPILIWSENIVKVKIPAGLAPGKYQAGVFCRDPGKGPTDSSGWLDFEIIKKTEK
jgi:hypothetical protein